MTAIIRQLKQHSSVSKIAVVLIVFITTVVSSNLNWGKDHWKQIIMSDGKGYYAYLPAVFIYNDLNLGFFDKIEKQDYYDVNLFYDYRSNANGKTINKYYCGTAIAQLPFFLTAHGMSHLMGFKPDGFSNLYHIFVNIAALFYLFIGLAFLNATLHGYQIGQWNKTLVLLATVFGTNLFYYTVREPGMSHVYSFAFISMFLFFARQYFATFHPKYLPLMALIMGLIFLIRPVNVLILFALPFIAGNAETLNTGFRKAISRPLLSIAVMILFFAVISVQAILYKISAGVFFVDAYIGERFDFLNPHLLEILFSYKKGLFLYTPVYLVSFTGLIFLWRTSKFSFFSWLVFFLLITWVFSSWWCWYYGGSFSSRVYVEFLPLFMILLATALHSIRNKRLKSAFVGLILILIVICQVQTYQYRYYHIHWSEMTREKYWDVFLRIDRLIQ
jgi:hypothetical protein